MISVIVIAKNEEEKIGDCLKSVKWADEIVVIDNGSIDSTCKIAERNGAKVFKLSEGSYSDLRNYGLKKASFEWVLYVDADERVTEKLRDEIELLIKDKDSGLKNSLYAIPRINIILGKELKHGGLWPDYVKRLFLKSKLKEWTGELHEEPSFVGSLGHLTNPLLHIKHRDFESMVEKTNKWSLVEAELMYKANHPKMNLIRFFSAMLREFWYRMIIKVAFLDGSVGIVYALYQVWSRFLSYAKLWEMQQKEQ